MDDNKGLSYFFLGLGFGVAVGLVFAPQTGEETRGLLKSKANDGKDFLLRQADVVKDATGEYVEKGKTVVAQQREQLSAAVEAGKQAYRETVAGPFDRPASS